MQKNVPKYTPPWVRTVRLWAESSRREVSYALCDDRRTLLWFANQRAVEYHPTLAEAGQPDRPDYLVLDIDPPSGGEFRLAVRAAQLVREALAGCGLAGAVKTSGAKGVHVFVPITQATAEDAAAATRAVAARAERLDPALATTAFIREDREGKVFLDSTRAGGATVVAAYSPRVRPGVPVSFPVPWDELDRVTPADFTVRTAARLITAGARWAGQLPAAAAAPRRPDRGGPHHPGRPGPGHARGQAAGPGPPRRRRARLARCFPVPPHPESTALMPGPGYRRWRRGPKRSQQKTSSAIHSHGPSPNPKPNQGQGQNSPPGPGRARRRPRPGRAARSAALSAAAARAAARGAAAAAGPGGAGAGGRPGLRARAGRRSARPGRPGSWRSSPGRGARRARPGRAGRPRSAGPAGRRPRPARHRRLAWWHRRHAGALPDPRVRSTGMWNAASPLSWPGAETRPAAMDWSPPSSGMSSQPAR